MGGASAEQDLTSAKLKSKMERIGSRNEQSRPKAALFEGSSRETGLADYFF
jgi:hypothetical protein